jgi:hypothetical protein
MKPAMSSLTTDNPVPPTFTLFRHLPAELQDEVWTHAAATPRLQYLLQNERNRVSHLRPSIFPHPESGIRAQSALSSVCHAAQAAVGRYTKTARDKATIADVIGYTLRRKPAKFYSFDLDLQNDLVCFGPPDADWDGPACFGVPGAVKDHQPAGLYASPWPCTQIAGAVRKFAMRCTPGWEYSAEGLSKFWMAIAYTNRIR